VVVTVDGVRRFQEHVEGLEGAGNRLCSVVGAESPPGR